MLLAVVAVAADEKKLKPDEGELRLARLDLLDSENGYAIPPDSVFYPGEKIHLGFNLAGYLVDDEYRIHLTWRADAVGPQGTPFAPAEGGEFDVELAPQDENWEPYVEYSAVLPPYAGSGTYTIRLEIEDKKAGAKLSRDVAVRVDGTDVELSDSLSIRNLQFALTKGGTPLPAPVVGQGESLFASFARASAT